MYSFMLQHFKKNSQIANHKAEGCIILAQSGCELLPQIGIYQSIVSHDAKMFQKKLCGRS